MQREEEDKKPRRRISQKRRMLKRSHEQSFDREGNPKGTLKEILTKKESLEVILKEILSDKPSLQRVVRIIARVSVEE